MNKLIYVLLAIFTLTTFASCGGSNDLEVVVLTSLTINTVDKDLYIGDTYQLTVSHQPTDVKLPKLTWTSSDTKIATVSNSGLLEIKADGVVTITAAYGNLNNSIILVIFNQNINLIYNEPLLLFGQSKENIKKTEVRELIASDDFFLQYKDSKADLSYQITYIFEDNKMKYINVVFNPGGNDIYNKLIASLALKYNKLTDTLFILDQLIISVTNSPEDIFIRYTI